MGLTSYRVENYDKDENEKAMRLQLDLVDEVRAVAEQRLARYQNLMANSITPVSGIKTFRSVIWYYER